MFRRSSAAATSREGHRQQGSGRAGQHRRWGRFNRHNALRPYFAMKLVRNISARPLAANTGSSVCSAARAQPVAKVARIDCLVTGSLESPEARAMLGPFEGCANEAMWRGRV